MHTDAPGCTRIEDWVACSRLCVSMLPGKRVDGLTNGERGRPVRTPLIGYTGRAMGGTPLQQNSPAQRQPGGCLLAIFRIFGLKPASASAQSTLPYRCKDYLLTAAERSFFAVLQQAVGEQYWVFPKVRVNDVIDVKAAGSEWRTYLHKIDRKHIDFLLCDRDTVRPVLAIELDDASHNRDDRKSRVQFLDAAFTAARLPLLHIPAKRGYAVPEVRAKIAELVQLR